MVVAVQLLPLVHSGLRSMLQSDLQLGLAVDRADLAIQSFLFLNALHRVPLQAQLSFLMDATSACGQAIHSAGPRGSWEPPASLPGWQLCLQSVPSRSQSHPVWSLCSCSWGCLLRMEPTLFLHADHQAVCCRLLRCSRRWLLCLQLIYFALESHQVSS